MTRSSELVLTTSTFDVIWYAFIGEAVESKHFVYISLGLILILIFSRTFGSGHLWEHVMGDDYTMVYKTVIQEGIELLGYIFVLYGSILVWVDALNKRPRDSQ